MPLFDYVGQLASGATFQGTLEAPGQEPAAATLAQMGVRVLTLRPARRTAYVAPLSLEEFAFFNEQLAGLTKAGLPLDEGLRRLAADVGSRKLKRLLLGLVDDLAAGTPLEDALRNQKARFPTHYAEVVTAGLRTGDLGGTLYGLATDLRLKGALRRTLLELAAYPLLVLLLAFGVSAFVMRAVVPRIGVIAQDMVWETGLSNQSLGASTFIFALANNWAVVEFSVIGLVALLLAGFFLLQLPSMESLRERVLRRTPGFAQVYWSSVVARFAHTSALAASSGTPLPELLAASGQASGSPALAKATRRVAERLTCGDALDAASADEQDVPALWTCAVLSAGPRGDLPAALAEIARTYELRAQHWVNTLRAFLGPLLFLVLAIGIGGLVVSVLVAINTLLRLFMSVTSY